MKNSKSGVAVIIVLGLLALLMVLGVAFTVAMRGERAGAANYLSAVEIRHMVWAGIANAIDTIDTEMGSAMYPPGDFLVSGAGNWNQSAGGGVALLRQQARAYVPDAVQRFLDGPGGNRIIRSEWLNIADGRVAYLIVNLSDMLDANHVGGEVRAGGRSVSEIMLATNILTVAQYADFVSLRSSGSDSFPSLSAFRYQASDAGLDVPANYFKTFSRYVPDNNRTNAVYIGGDVSELEANQAEIVAGLRRLREPLLPENQARLLFTNLLDYVDASLVPANLNGPNTKPVPMINELVMGIVIATSGANLFIALRPEIETWAPFANPSGSRFTIAGSYMAAVSESGGGVTSYSGDFVSDEFEINRSTGFNRPSINQTVGSPPSPYPMVASTNMFEITISLTNLVVQTESVVVDRVNGNFVFRGNWTEGVAPGAIDWRPATYQVTDPRFNWLASAITYGTTPWQTNAPPPAAPATPLSPNILGMNTWAQFFLSLRNSTTFSPQNDVQLGAKLHVSGRGHLDSPLELGNLLLLQAASLANPANYWRNIRVFDHVPNVRRHRILENFTTNRLLADDTSDPMRGLININSTDPRILRTAFANMPHPYIGGSLLQVAYPERLDAVIAVLENHLNANGSFGSVSELLELNWRGNPTLENLSDFELESLLAYVIEILGVRQNLFLIVVSAAPTMPPGSQAPVVRGRSSAMALVWRDPVANAQGLHDNFIRYFRWLD